MPENRATSSLLYDLLVVGSGPGGYTAAIRAAQLGAKVAVVEKEHLGGTCTNKGCIPTKALVAAVRSLETIERASALGVKVGKPEIDLVALQEHKSKTVRRLRKGIESLFKSYDIDLVTGRGEFTGETDSETLWIEVTRGAEHLVLQARRVIIATGSIPASVSGADIDGNKIMTSDHILELSEVPSSLLVVGAGTIGLEFASIFNALGSKVTLVEMMPQIAPGEDEEIAELLRCSLVKKGIEIETATHVKEFRIRPDGVEVRLTGGESESASASVFPTVLIAVGRRPYIEGLGLERIGVETDAQQIKVNRKMETSRPGVYAIGDVVGGTLLAHVAAAEGIVAAENAMGKTSEIDYRVIPNCIYTCPEMASVGLTETRARQADHKVNVGKFPFSANGKALAWDEARGLVKVVADEDTGEVLGVHIIGHQATELISQAVVALKLEATIEEFDRISWAHPTLSEAIMEAVMDVRKQAIDLPRKDRGGEGVRG
ncbi:MAG: dihydrolipoyl dehydrogenase [Candidatus Latescibacteria bacterium 4484_181]|nr:MAG: dihydrolipoyl dehydrogenase [Candidatus Latescibacteria bacterium 4484_181]